MIAIPAIMLLQIFAACPCPGPPTWATLRPIVARTGRARSKPAAEPPTMNVRVAAAAPATPPDTGASIIS